MKLENTITLYRFSKALYEAYSNNEDVVIDKEIVNELYNEVIEAQAVKENYDDFVNLKKDVENDIENAIDDASRTLRREIMNIITDSLDDVVDIKHIHL